METRPYPHWWFRLVAGLFAVGGCSLAVVESQAAYATAVLEVGIVVVTFVAGVVGLRVLHGWKMGPERLFLSVLAVSLIATWVARAISPGLPGTLTLAPAYGVGLASAVGVGVRPHPREALRPDLIWLTILVVVFLAIGPVVVLAVPIPVRSAVFQASTVIAIVCGVGFIAARRTKRAQEDESAPR